MHALKAAAGRSAGYVFLVTVPKKAAGNLRHPYKSKTVFFIPNSIHVYTIGFWKSKYQSKTVLR